MFVQAAPKKTIILVVWGGGGRQNKYLKKVWILAVQPAILLDSPIEIRGNSKGPGAKVCNWGNPFTIRTKSLGIGTHFRIISSDTIKFSRAFPHSDVSFSTFAATKKSLENTRFESSFFKKILSASPPLAYSFPKVPTKMRGASAEGKSKCTTTWLGFGEMGPRIKASHLLSRRLDYFG